MNKNDKIIEIMDNLRFEIESLLAEHRRLPQPFEAWGGVIRNARRAQKMTQVELADLTAISISTLKRMEAGRREVSLENLLKVLDALGVKLWIG